MKWFLVWPNEESPDSKCSCAIQAVSVEEAIEEWVGGAIGERLVRAAELGDPSSYRANCELRTMVEVNG